MHIGLIAGLLVLGFFAPPRKPEKMMKITIGTMGPGTNPLLPPGPLAGGGPKKPEAPAPAKVEAPAPAKKEEPAPTPAPTASPKPQATPKPAPTAAPTPRPAKPPVVVPNKTPAPQTKPVVNKPSIPTIKAPAKPMITRRTKTKQKLVEIQHTPTPTPKPTPTPEPVPLQTVEGTVGDERNDQPVAETAPPVPAVPAVPAPPAPGPGGTGTGTTAAPSNVVTAEIFAGSGGGVGPAGPGIGPGGGGGGGSLLNALGLTYFAVVRQRIEENFNLPYSRPGEKCVIQFVIMKDGTINNIQIVQRSNYDNLDHMAVQALEMSKVPPLYDGMNTNALTINLTFYFEKKN